MLKYSGEAIAPPRCCQYRHGADHLGNVTDMVTEKLCYAVVSSRNPDCNRSRRNRCPPTGYR